MTKEEFRIKVIAARRKYVARKKKADSDFNCHLHDTLRKKRKQANRAKHASQNPN